jgi:Carboxypeptidase regulatory-like domain
MEQEALMKRKLFTGAGWVVLAFLVVLHPVPAHAQAVANAQLRGVITDASGAVVPGARVTVIQTDTGQSRTTMSDSDGLYVLPNLPVGPYRLTVTKSAFSTYIQSGIVLEVGANVQVNVALKVGQVTQQVEVSANATMVDTQKTAVGQVIDQRRIVALPLNGRHATDLIMLSGGASLAPSATQFITTHDFPSAVAISVAGTPGNANNYLLDGADNRDSHSDVNLPFPFPDALQEFNVETGTLSGRNGLQSGALVNVVTKSGTNQFHGDAFEFVRNGDFNARNFFAPKQDTLRRNQFGGTMGGPIIKNKLFFFGGFQATREVTAPLTSVAYVPTQDVLNGDFSTIESAACQSSGNALTLTNPSTGQPFSPTNYIDPTTYFSTPSLNLLKNVPVSSDPCGRFLYTIPSKIDENQFIGRGDWRVNSKITMFARYFLDRYSNPAVFTNNILTTTRSGLHDYSHAAVLAANLVLSPNILNAVHVSFERLEVDRGVAPGIPNPVSLGVNMFNQVPGYIDLSVSNHFGAGGGSNAPAFFIRNQFQFADDTDWIHGRNHYSFGVNWIPVQMDEDNIQRANGTFAFNGTFTGDPLADFMIGGVSSLIQQSPFEIGLRQKYIGLYFQDDMKVTNRLNVNIGVRWEPNLQERDVQGRGYHFSTAAFLAGQTTKVYNTAPPGLQYFGDPGIPQAYARSSYKDFAPRLGFAWDPTGSGKMSIRADYGIFFDQPEAYTTRDWGNSAPWGNQINLISPSGGFSDPWASYPGGNPFPFPPPNPNSPFPLQAQYINFPLDLHHPYIQKWDLSFQRQLGKDWLLSVAYQGNKGTHLRAGYDMNSAVYMAGATTGNTNQRRILYLQDPVAGAYYGQILMLDDGVNSNYRGLKVGAQHRFSRNFTLITSYTYSRCMQDAETIGNRLDATTYQDPFNRNADYGNCDPDLTHNFVASFISTSPRFTNHAAEMLAGNWQFSTIFSAHDGFPFNPVTGVDASLTGEGQDRPNLTGDPYTRNMNTLQWLNGSAFAPNAPGTYGNVGFNSLRGPGFINFDMGLDRNFKVTESKYFELRFEFFNIFNHPNFDLPASNLHSGGSFGRIQSAADPRIIQLGAKFIF